MPGLPTSLPKICVALGLPDAEQLLRVAEAEYKEGNTFLEFRLDYLKTLDRGAELIANFRSRCPESKVLATCRRREAGGHYGGAPGRQVEILGDAADAGAMAVDVEIECAEKTKGALSLLRQKAALLVSYHSFHSTPAPAGILRRLHRIPADAYKLVTTATKPRDVQRLTEFVKAHRGTPLISFAMSEQGLASRVLSTAFGCAFTYASPSTQTGTAPGQIAAKTMRSLYRSDRLGKGTRIYGVIADPVGHSKSPVIHNRAFHAKRLDAVYLPFLVPTAQLSDWMKLALTLPVCGFSVTIPHKRKIMRYLDQVEPLAKRIGAVNTVWRKAGRWRGTNTDAAGVLQPLSHHLKIARSSILIAGYGGAARAAAIALADAGAQICITGRDARSGTQLARVVKGQFLSLSQAEDGEFDALINATPVGMTPKPDATLFRDEIPAQIVFDMVYNPLETVLLKRAREQGCILIHGSEMLLAQAACQFEIWSGEQAPQAVMKTALEQALQT